MTIDQVRQLKPGDIVTWNDPDGGICSRTSQIRYVRLAHDEDLEPEEMAVSIEWANGGYIQCFASELSRYETEGQFMTVCPHCGVEDELIVTSVVLAATGKRTRPGTPLTKDGFVVDPRGIHEHLDDQSTEGEKVRCENCGKRFDLEDLMWG